MLEKYQLKLAKLTEEINSYFDEQKDFIKCSAGCGICCTKGYYPLFELEYKYLKKGLELHFSQEKIKNLQDKAHEIYKNRQNFLKNDSNVHNFFYVCPFLENDKCSIYSYRPIICRTYGLISRDFENTKTKIHLPHCVSTGLNYADVWNSEAKSFSKAKIEAFGIKTEPKFYDISFGRILESFQELPMGDSRMLYEWIFMDIPDYQKLFS
ncbi:MAG: YkgJ family cysteine cluster protein [bacterium]